MQKRSAVQKRGNFMTDVQWMLIGLSGCFLVLSALFFFRLITGSNVEPDRRRRLQVGGWACAIISLLITFLTVGLL